MNPAVTVPTLAPTFAPATSITTPSRKARWTGRIMTGLVAAFLAFDAIIKLVMIQPVIDGARLLGYPPSTMVTMGVLLLGSLIIHLIPRTALIGAVLLTGYLGGAIATHIRVENPLFSHTLFPTYVAALVWGGLYLRDRRVRALLAPRA